MKSKNERRILNLLSFFLFTFSFSANLFAQNEEKYFVFFETDSFHLTPIIQTDIKNFIKEIPADEILRLYVIGHTDSEGSESYNFQLSEKRASTIANHILSFYPEYEQLIRITYEGESQPIASNNTQNGKAKNRRVTVRAIRKPPIKKVYADGYQSRKAAQQPSSESIAVDTSNFYIQLSIIDSVSKEILNGSISIFTQDGNRVSSPFKISDHKSIKAKFPKLKNEYIFCGESKTYMYACIKQPVSTLDSIDTIQIELGKLVKGREVILKDLRFFTDQAVLKPESLPELNSLVKTMQENGGLHIMIKGHANWPYSYGPTPNYIFRLSNARAQAVYSYLVNFAISPNRMLYKGIGNKELLYPEPMTDEEVQANKRVNFIILKL